jgi:hypothetical protein
VKWCWWSYFPSRIWTRGSWGRLHFSTQQFPSFFRRWRVSLWDPNVCGPLHSNWVMLLKVYRVDVGVLRWNSTAWTADFVYEDVYSFCVITQNKEQWSWGILFSENIARKDFSTVTLGAEWCMEVSCWHVHFVQKLESQWLWVVTWPSDYVPFLYATKIKFNAV